MYEYDPDLIVTDENRSQVIDYLCDNHGHSRLDAQTWSNVTLMNTYHNSDLHRATSAAIIMTVANLPRGQVDEKTVRELARDEASKLIANLPPQRIEIISTDPDTSVTIDGPVHHATENVIRITALNHPVMMIGPAGCGKTTIAQHTAEALSLPFYMTGTVSDTHELVGFQDGHGVYHTTPFRQAFEHGGVWLADELDAWDANALLAANSAIANGICVFPDKPEPVQRHENFRIIATANTFGTGADRVYVGRNELDGATLDRFATINVTYDDELEKLFANGQHEWLTRVRKIREIVMNKNIRHVVSSRAVSAGAAALNAGFDFEFVENAYLFKGMSSRDRAKIT